MTQELKENIQIRDQFPTEEKDIAKEEHVRANRIQDQFLAEEKTDIVGPPLKVTNGATAVVKKVTQELKILGGLPGIFWGPWWIFW